jgi:serine protease Do
MSNSRFFLGMVSGGMASVLAAGSWFVLQDDVSSVALAQDRQRPKVAAEDLEHARSIENAFKAVAKSMQPSVVSIRAITRVEPAVRSQRNGQRPQRQARPELPEEFRRFFGDDLFDGFGEYNFDLPEQPFEREGQGTGIIVTKDGYILTNNHVVRGATELEVSLSDGRKYTAKVIGTDSHTDVAVVKVDADDLTPAALGDSSALEVGEWVVAIGSPFGLHQTVTAGIVSAKGRAGVGITDYEDFIQTDAAINPGNSGGPLTNLKGEVVGINTAIASRTGAYNGIGFAIPSNMARHVMDSLIRSGKVERGYLGASIQNLDQNLARSFNYNSTDGVLIGDVAPDGPAAKAGLKSGDIVVSYNGRPTNQMHELRNAVAATSPGTSSELEVFRDGRRMKVSIDVGKLEEDKLSESPLAPSEEGPEEGLALDFGANVQTVTPELARQYDLGRVERGAVVTDVLPASLAAGAGLSAGDVIVGVNNKAINSAEDLEKALTDDALAQGVRLRVFTDGLTHYVFIQSR